MEHGAVVPPELFADLAALGVVVVTQPSFVRERGDQYLTDVEVGRGTHLHPARPVGRGGFAEQHAQRAVRCHGLAHTQHLPAHRAPIDRGAHHRPRVGRGVGRIAAECHAHTGLRQ